MPSATSFEHGARPSSRDRRDLTGASTPSWNGAPAGTTVDGSVVWQNIGLGDNWLIPFGVAVEPAPTASILVQHRRRGRRLQHGVSSGCRWALPGADSARSRCPRRAERPCHHRPSIRPPPTQPTARSIQRAAGGRASLRHDADDAGIDDRRGRDVPLQHPTGRGLRVDDQHVHDDGRHHSQHDPVRPGPARAIRSTSDALMRWAAPTRTTSSSRSLSGLVRDNQYFRRDGKRPERGRHVGLAGHLGRSAKGQRRLYDRPV